MDRQIASAFAWWREAGVDCDFDDAPRAWLAEPDAPVDAAPPPPAVPVIKGTPKPEVQAAAPALDTGSLPDTLEAFTAWWMTEPLLDGGHTGRRVPPRGSAGADLMVLVSHPEAEDRERLMSGRSGGLLDAMLSAMGLAHDDVYVASALPRHTPHADWAAAKQAGMGEVLAHHVALVAPKRLLSFGGNIPPLLGNDLPISAAGLHRINQKEATISWLAERDLAAFVERPGWKSGFWRRWLDFTV